MEEFDPLFESLFKLEKEWGKYNQTTAWTYLQNLIMNTSNDDFDELNQLLIKRINFIKKICM
jgi:hypothetical protein